MAWCKNCDNAVLEDGRLIATAECYTCMDWCNWMRKIDNPDGKGKLLSKSVIKLVALSVGISQVS